MSDGDCELVQDMKSLVIENCNLRDLDYSASCVPQELSINGFAVKGQTLKVTTPKSRRVRGMCL
jgi:hypothetical protein